MEKGWRGKHSTVKSWGKHVLMLLCDNICRTNSPLKDYNAHLLSFDSHKPRLSFNYTRRYIRHPLVWIALQNTLSYAEQFGYYMWECWGKILGIERSMSLKTKTVNSDRGNCIDSSWIVTSGCTARWDYWTNINIQKCKQTDLSHCLTNSSVGDIYSLRTGCIEIIQVLFNSQLLQIEVRTVLPCMTSSKACPETSERNNLENTTI